MLDLKQQKHNAQSISDVSKTRVLIEMVKFASFSSLGRCVLWCQSRAGSTTSSKSEAKCYCLQVCNILFLGVFICQYDGGPAHTARL